MAHQFSFGIRYLFNDAPATEIYTLSLHDLFRSSDPHRPELLGALHIPGFSNYVHRIDPGHLLTIGHDTDDDGVVTRSEEHTSELQSQSKLVCRLLLDKKKTNGLDPQGIQQTRHL